MKNTFKSNFSRKAGAVFLASVMAGSSACVSSGRQPVEKAEGDDTNISLLVPEGKKCFSLAEVNHPKNPITRYMARQYAEIRETEIGRMLFDASESEPVIVCYNRDLDKNDECGHFRAGVFNGILSLNPAERVSEAFRSSAAVHEMRHRFQRSLGLSYGKDGNVPERERVVMYWLVEADARISAILYAFQKAEKGDESYMKALYRDQKMVDAFYKTLNPERTNLPEAARAGMLAFLQGQYLAAYANDVLDSHLDEFDPAEPKTPFLSIRTLLKMGEIGYGNYMTPEVVDTFNMAFSEESYQALKAARASKGGQTCTL